MQALTMISFYIVPMMKDAITASRLRDFAPNMMVRAFQAYAIEKSRPRHEPSRAPTVIMSFLAALFMHGKLPQDDVPL